MDEYLLVPAANVLVRDPYTMAALPPEGKVYRKLDKHMRRRIADGSVTKQLVKPKSAPAKPSQKSMETEK